MNASPTPVSDLELERFALGELPAVRLAALRTALATDAELAARLERLRGSDKEILSRYPNSAGEIARRLSAATTRGSSRAKAARPVVALFTGAAAAALILAAPSAEPENRIKGLAPSLVAYRAQNGQLETVPDGAHAHAGDRLQLAYRAAGRRYGVVLSLDGAGEVTVHLPPTRLSADGETALPHSFELDAAPAFERFWLITSDTPIDPDQVLDAARSAARWGGTPRASLPLPGSLEQTTLLVVKDRS